MIRVEPFQGTDQDWDSHLSRFEGATFCHLGAWRAVFRDAMGHESHYRAAVDGKGEVQGLLPLIRVKSRLFGDYLVSMPFLNYGGPLGSEAAREALGRDAADLARELGVDLLELRSRTPVPGDLETSHRKLTVLLELPYDPALLWEKGLKAKVRSQVRRPMKEGMEPRFGLRELDDFYRVFARTMRDLGTPVLPKAFFSAIAEHLGGHVVICTIRTGGGGAAEGDGGPEGYKGGESGGSIESGGDAAPGFDAPTAGQAVAAACGFLFNGEFEITWAGALREYNQSAPNMLLYWSLMEESIRRKAEVFNFGRCSPDSGTHRFKRQWGGEDLPLPWARWSPGGITATPTPTGKKYEMATGIWRKLPVPLANVIGPLVARSIP